MNVARMAIFLSIVFFGCIGANAQVNCQTSGKLVCLVPVVSNAVDGQFTTQTAISQAAIFSGPIGTQLTQLPLAASAPGVVILTTHGTPQLFDNLGPVLIDRPDTLTRGRLVVGFSGEHFNFNHLDGIGVGSIPFVFSQPSTDGLSTQYLSQTENVSLSYNQYVLLASYGLPKKTDISVILPFTQVSIGASQQKPLFFSVAATGASNGTLVGVPASGTSQNIAGSAQGPGDVVFNVKHELYGDEGKRGSVAAGAAIRFPTGDALNYLGSGAYGVNLYALAAYKRRLSPHVKIGYQWNTNSVLLNIANTAGVKARLPGGAQYAVGADFAATGHLTVSADILGNEFQNAPSITAQNINPSSANAACATVVTQTSTCAGSLASVTSGTSTYTTADFSFGMKLKVYSNPKHGQIIAYGNVLIQMNNVGLRADPSPSGGISYNFGGLDKWPHWLYR